MPKKESDQGATGISRRGFLKGVGAGAVATGIVNAKSSAPKAAAQATAAPVGPGNVSVTLSINGNSHQLNIEPRVTLLDALRNRLDITGAKKVCDKGTCGACTVMLDGDVVYACSILAIEANGREVTTVEGLGAPGDLSDMQEAFIKHDGSQCGFCTPGFIVATTAFVKDNPNATLEEVREGLGGNLCRCGTYAGITQAALEVAKGGA